jgi:protein gp37
MKLRWAKQLKEKCMASGTVFFFKQVSAPRSGEGEKALGKVYHDWPETQLVQIGA